MLGVQDQEAHDTPQTFEQILKQELYEPLQMYSPTYAPSQEAIQEGRVLALGPKDALAGGHGTVPPPDNARNGAGGTCFMSPSDEAKFLQAMMEPELPIRSINKTEKNISFVMGNRHLFTFLQAMMARCIISRLYGCKQEKFPQKWSLRPPPANRPNAILPI